MKPVRLQVMDTKPGALPHPFRDIAESLVHRADQARCVAVDGRAQNDGIADMRVPAQGRMEQGEHAAHAPAVQ